MRRWPLFLIAAPAAVSIWSGWVGLGGLAGFGVVHPLPGIWDSLRLNTAITLPVGVEAYAAYALGAWMAPATPARARAFAGRSALGALALGILGQVSYHLLAAGHATRAPAPVIVGVSCMPVIVLGLGAALTHLLRAGDGEPGEDSPPAGKVSAPPWTDAETAALEALRRTTAAGNPLTANKLSSQFRLTRAETARVCDRVAVESNGHKEITS